MTRKTSFCILHSAFCIRLLALCIVHCALCIPSAFATTITAVADGAKAGDLKTVTATVSGGTVDALYLVYHAVGSSFVGEGVNTNEMTGSGTTYTGYLPPLPGGTVLSWFVTDGTVSSETYATTLDETPDYNRYHDGKIGETKVWVVGVSSANQIAAPAAQQDAVNGWKYDSGSYSNVTAQTPNGSQWKASGVGLAISKANLGGTGIDETIGMEYSTIYFQNIPLSSLPYIRSPKLEGGVGTIDFKSRLVSANNTIRTSELTVQVAYTLEDPTETDWVDVAVYKYGTDNGNVFSRINHLVINDYGVTFVRILRTGYNIYNTSITTGRLAVDNLCISKPPANVGIIEKLKNPGYPAADQDILMRCAVTNCVEETPAINRRVSVRYKYVARESDDPGSSAAPWLSADMAYKGKDGAGLDWYEGTIPTQKVGYVWYYYQVDYDGYAWSGAVTAGGPTVNESISPAFWDDGEDTHARPAAGARFQVRPYRSRYARIALTAQNQDLSVGEMTLVGDELWQTIVPVNGASVVSNYFVGYSFYADDADAYEAAPVLWGENNPDALSDPTLAGFLESSHDTIVTNQLVALNEKDYRGFYLYRFSSNDYDEEAANTSDGDRRYDYIVKKAVYQDFDDWTASPDYYESSLGGLPTLTYTENFDGNAASALGGAVCVTNAWYEDTYEDSYLKREIFDDDDLSDDFSKDDITTFHKFKRKTGSRIIADRKTKNTDQSVNQTLALELNGRIENTSDSLTYGLEKVAFRARASVDDSNFAIYKNGTAWAIPANNNSIYVNATWGLDQMAPSKPYLSYIFLYQPADQWGEYGASWYEVRIVQTDSADNANETIRVELWRRDATAATTVRVSNTINVGYSGNYTGFNLKSSRTVNVRGYNNANKFYATVTIGNKTITVYDPTANQARLAKGGSIGFGVFDAVPNITAVKVGSANNGNDLLNSLSSTYGDWSAGGRRSDDSNSFRWTITSGAITRPVTQKTIGLYSADCVGGEYQAKAFSATADETVTVSSLDMTGFTVNFKAWNKKFVQLRYEAGDGGVVIDDLWCYPWRAKTRHNGNSATVNGVGYLDWTDQNQQETWLDSAVGAQGDTMHNHWAVMEGWVVNSGAFAIGANFERSRANTNLVQGVVSPVLENGIGSVSFSYTASGGRVVYGVERTDGSDDDKEIYQLHNWTPVAVFTNNAGTSGERYVKIGKYFKGRVRVRIYGRDDVADLLSEDNKDCGYEAAWGYTDDTAKLLVDNLRVKDYPEDENDNAWNAYNLRITGDAAYAEQGLIYNNSGKSCFFNNSETNGVYGAEEFTEDDPYLESPPLRGVGVGEIAFQYRLLPGSAGAGVDGHLVIKVAPERDTPLAQWKTITNLTVSASGTAAFVKFDNEKIFDEKNFVVRFYNSRQPGTPRIIIDNVLVTAPARASFEFEYVSLLPAQPLAGTNTVVEAKIMREIMNPKNIRIYCSYHKYDTNDVNDVWGVENWFDPLTSPTIELTQVTGVEKVYRTPADGGIPAFDVDDVIEFVVWGVHKDINIYAGETPIKQGEDSFKLPSWYKTLNTAADVLVDVDMNADHAAEGWSPYFWVFSSAPGTFFVNEINNWRTYNSTDDAGTAEYIEFVGPAGTDIGGWTFKVVGTSLDSDLEYKVPGGTKLANDKNGWGFFMWADAWASGSFRVDAAFPDSASAATENIGTYGGILVYRSNGMLEQIGRHLDPKKENYGQRAFGVTFGTETRCPDGAYYGYSTRKKNHYTDSISLVSIEDEDDETVVGRTVDDFTWDIVAQTPSDVNGAGQVFADLGGDTPAVALYYPDGTEITDADVLGWIETYNAGRSTSDIQTDIDELTMDEFNKDFLLNLDFTKACVAELKITSIEIIDGVVYLGVQLTRTENNEAVGRRAINGRLKLLGKADLATGAFAPLQPESYDSEFSTGNAIGIEYELPAQNPPAFFKVVIEEAGE